MSNFFFQSIRLARDIEFKELLKKTDINAVNEYKQNALQEAISYKNETAALILIEGGIDLNHLDDKGLSALHYCGLHKSIGICKKILLNQSVDVNIKDIYGNNPLWTAVFNSKGMYEIVRKLMAHGGDPYSTNKAGRTPLSFARQINNADLVAILEKKMMK